MITLFFFFFQLICEKRAVKSEEKQIWSEWCVVVIKSHCCALACLINKKSVLARTATLQWMRNIKSEEIASAWNQCATSINHNINTKIEVKWTFFFISANVYEIHDNLCGASAKIEIICWMAVCLSEVVRCPLSGPTSSVSQCQSQDRQWHPQPHHPQHINHHHLHPRSQKQLTLGMSTNVFEHTPEWWKVFN